MSTVELTDKEIKELGEKRYFSQYGRKAALYFIALMATPPIIIQILHAIGIGCDKCKWILLGLFVVTVIPALWIIFRYNNNRVKAGKEFLAEVNKKN